MPSHARWCNTRPAIDGQRTRLTAGMEAAAEASAAGTALSEVAGSMAFEVEVGSEVKRRCKWI